MQYDLLGFQWMIPVWIWVSFLVLSIVVSWWTYKAYSSIPTVFKTLLIAFRLIALAILLALLLNPVLQHSTEITRKPVVTYLIDDTGSLAIQKGTWNSSQSMSAVTETLQSVDTSGVRIKKYRFSRGISPIQSLEDLTYQSSGTDIHQALSAVATDIETDYLILVTDGISTTGRDPVFATRQLDIPVHTVAVGDTSQQRDLVLQQIQYPERAFTNAVIPIVASIRNEGFPSDTITVELRSGNQVLETKQVETTAARSTHQLTFEYETDEAGPTRLGIHILPKESEWNTENNSRQFTLDVQDDQISVLSLSFELHPDVGAARSVLAGNPAVRLTERSWLGGERFSEGVLPTRRDTFNLVVVHGIPGNLPEQLQSHVSAFLSDVSSVFFYTPGSNRRMFEEIIAPITALQADFSRSRTGVQLVPVGDQAGHAILDLPALEFNRTPILQSPVTGIRASSGASPLFNATIRGETSTTPLIAVRQTGNLRNASIMASGWHLYFQSTDDAHREWADQLITNIVNWASADLDERQFVVRPASPEFESGESVTLQANLLDDAGSPAMDADIRVQITGDEIDSRSFSMLPAGPGLYRVEIPALPDGQYQFSAQANIGRQQLGERSGTFSVGGSSVELINTVRNDEILRQIANQTGGTFSLYSDMSALIEYLNSLKQHVSQEVSETPVYLNRNPLWFVILMLLLAGEWLIRKRFALP